jgi:hypothetical protein
MGLSEELAKLTSPELLNATESVTSRGNNVAEMQRMIDSLHAAFPDLAGLPDMIVEHSGDMDPDAQRQMYAGSVATLFILSECAKAEEMRALFPDLNGESFV